MALIPGVDLRIPIPHGLIFSIDDSVRLHNCDTEDRL